MPTQFSLFLSALVCEIKILSLESPGRDSPHSNATSRAGHDNVVQTEKSGLYCMVSDVERYGVSHEQQRIQATITIHHCTVYRSRFDDFGTVAKTHQSGERYYVNKS